MKKGYLLLLDRGYPSFMLFYVLSHEKECKFVMRAKVNFNEIANAFCYSDQRDKAVLLPATYKAIQGLKQEQITIDADTMVKVRLVKVRLDSREEELLITNLYDEDKYSLSDLKALYFLRWGIEVSYGLIKNELQIESFSGINPICIEQDFYANIFVFSYSIVLFETHPFYHFLYAWFLSVHEDTYPVYFG